jgi:hypothetical protein
MFPGKRDIGKFEIDPDLPTPRFGSSVGAKLSFCSAMTMQTGQRFKDLPYPGYGRSEAQSGSMVEVTPVLREFSVLPDTTFRSTWNQSGRRGGFGKEERSQNFYLAFERLLCGWRHECWVYPYRRKAR